MEVASPLTFGHSSAGTKRHLPCTSGFADSTNRSPFSMGLEPAEVYTRSSKRYKFTADENMESESENIANQYTFSTQASPQKSLFSSSSGEFFIVDLFEVLKFAVDLVVVTSEVSCLMSSIYLCRLIYIWDTVEITDTICVDVVEMFWLTRWFWAVAVMLALSWILLILDPFSHPHHSCFSFYFSISKAILSRDVELSPVPKMISNVLLKHKQKRLQVWRTKNPI